MKLTKEELAQKIDSLEVSEDVKVSLMEDIADSLEMDVDTTELDGLRAELETVKNDLETANSKVAEITQKYKDRFMGKEEKEDINDGLEEKTVIDVKEI